MAGVAMGRRAIGWAGGAVCFLLVMGRGDGVLARADSERDMRARAAAARAAGAEADRTGRIVRTADGRRVRYPAAPRGSLLTQPPAVQAQALRLVGRAPDVLPPPVDPAALRWRFAATGVLGAGGLGAADIDDDGRVEVVADTRVGGPFFIVYEWRDGECAQEWVSPLLSPPGDVGSWSVDSLRVANLDADPALEIVVGMGDHGNRSRLLVFDGATHELERSLESGQGDVFSLEIVDVDSDGAVELVYLTNVFSDPNLKILDLATGVEEANVTGIAAQSLAVGDVDGDGTQEIVTLAQLGAGSILDGRTRAVEGAFAPNGGWQLRVADLDGDGRPEIIGGFRTAGETFLQALDGVTLAPRWSHAVEIYVDALRIVDVSGDATPEVVYGDDQWGSIHALDSGTGAALWSVANPEHGVADIAVGDLDGDGERELIWSAGWTSSGADYLYVVDMATQALEWRSEDLNGPFPGLAYGDVDADGSGEVVAGSVVSESGYGTGRWLVFDAESGKVEYQGGNPTGGAFAYLRALSTVNLDQDPQLEVLATSSSGRHGRIFCYDGATHQEEWEFAPQSEESTDLRALQAADIDGDGVVEVMVAGDRSLYVLDGPTGTQEWSVPFATSWVVLGHMRVANVDSDAALEIVLVRYLYDGDEVLIVDGRTHAVRQLKTNLSIRALDLPEIGPSEVHALVVGDASGRILRLSSSTGAVLETLADLGYEAPIDALVGTRDLLGDGALAWVVATDSDVRVVDGTSGWTLWTGDTIAESTLPERGLLVADIDDDGRSEVVVDSVRGVDVLDLAPRISISGPSSVLEGDGEVALTVRLPQAQEQAVTVDYQTRNGTARNGQEYVTANGSLTFAPGETEKTVSVTLLDDALDESDKTFVFVVAERPATGVSASTRVVTIVDDDPTPSLILADAAIAEGETRRIVSLTARLSAPSGQSASVGYRTLDGRARSGSDYLPASGSLLFPPGATEVRLPLTILGDPYTEPDESFFLVLDPLVNVTADRTTVRVTLTNDDVRLLSIGDIQVREGRNATFLLRLSRPAPDAVSVAWRTVDGTASAASGDYVPGRGVASFAAGATTARITVRINRDGRVEPAETFSVRLGTPNAGVLLAGSGLGTATIRD